ncbi:MAG: SDR family oxidoreductase [Nanoarchaeota archaeon]|nr:SDR family oxidoreductase [Nanoarchaeota archaeon]
MDLDLNNKIVIISGGANGIGAEATRYFSKEGAIPIILDIDEEAGQEISRKVPKSHFIKTDLTNESDCKNAIDTVLEKYKNIHILINNAGINDKIGLNNSVEDFEKSLKKNLIHYFILVKYSWEALKKTKGSIVNISSKVAVIGQGKTSGYAASNGAILALTKEWAIEGLPFNIRVNAIVPAEVYTKGYKKWLKLQENPTGLKKKIEDRIPLGKRMTTPKEIAKSILYLASDMSSHSTGEVIFPDGGYVNIDYPLFD